MTGCGGPPVAGERAEGSGTLQLGLTAERDGVRYFLEAVFVVSGPETVYLSSSADHTSVVHGLGAGSYAVEIQEGFRVLREVAGALEPVDAELLSERTQPFTIASQTTTRVSYRFLVDGEPIVIGRGELDIGFEIETAPSCDDGRQNQDEGGVDCGGSCPLSCNSASIRFVAPYVGTSGRAGRLVARGAGFESAGPGLSVMLGNLEIGPLSAEDDTEVALDYPALPAGRYPVRVKASSAGAQSELVIVEPLEPVAARLDSPGGERTRVVYDAERRTLYAANRSHQQIERYRNDVGDWTPLSPVTVPRLTDLAMTPDGRSLIVLSEGAINEIELGVEPPAIVARVDNPDPFCGGYFDELAMGNDGKALVIFNLAQCSGFTPSYLYDSVDDTLTASPYPSGYFYNGTSTASADGTRVYVGSNGISPASRITIFHTRSWRLDTATPVSYNLAAATVSGDASRVILQDGDVYDRELRLLGFVPSGGRALASRDSSRAFVYRDDGEAPSVVVHDLNAPELEPGALYPVIDTLPLLGAPNPQQGQTFSIRMAASPDDSMVFVSGVSFIFAVPVD